MPRENRKDTDKSENLCKKGYEKPYEKHINLKTSTWYVKEGKVGRGSKIFPISETLYGFLRCFVRGFTTIGPRKKGVQMEIKLNVFKRIFGFLVLPLF